MDKIISLERSIEPRAIEGSDRKYEFIISTEDVDMHRTVFLAEGIDLSRYANNNIVTFGHPDFNSNNPDDVIGTSEIRTEGKNTIAVLTLEPEGDNPVADKVARKIANGTLKMASIRAVPTEAEYQERNGEDIKTFTKWRLIDWGVVSHGSNPAALARSVKEAADSLIVEEKKENCLKRKVQAMEIELL
jgi:hypothetical protein